MRNIKEMDKRLDEREQEIGNLQKENKQLKDLLHKANDEVISYTNCCIDLKERIDKAIEYIKSQQVIFKDYDIVVDNQLKNILEILGDKENE